MLPALTLLVIALISIANCSAATTLKTTSCKHLAFNEIRALEYRCYGLTTLQARLDMAKNNVTTILITESNIENIPGVAFIRFASTLTQLDLHESGIKSIDVQAFAGLRNLQNLVLWGNNLTYIQSECFIGLQNLKNLDISFNKIVEIDPRTFQLLPNLENFAFDYNQLSYIHFDQLAWLGKLKRATFGKNPWTWTYRAKLQWQFDNQNVEYDESWENWRWMSASLLKCVESGRGDLPSDDVLDCATEKLLKFIEMDIERPNVNSTVEFSTLVPIQCQSEAKAVLGCFRRSNSPGKSDGFTARKTLESLFSVLKPMDRPQATFQL